MSIQGFTHKTINHCECWDKGNFRIIQNKNNGLYNAYVVSSKDEKGNANGYRAIDKFVQRTERKPDIDNSGKPKKDGQGQVIMKDYPVMAAQEYPTLEAASAVCVV